MLLLYSGQGPAKVTNEFRENLQSVVNLYQSAKQVDLNA